MIDYKIEQRCAIKFCLKLEMNTTETCGKLQDAYGNDALSRAPFLDGSKTFQRVEIRLKMSLDQGDQQHQKLTKILVRSDRRLTIRLRAERMSLNKSTVHHILTSDLETRKISAKLVPKHLTVQQKRQQKRCKH